jgi:general secretion pathway protein H
VKRAAFPQDAGFSLIEVLTAMAVVAVMAGAVVVYMGGGETPAREAADRLATRLAEAREYALVSGEAIGFAADFDARGWRFFHAPDGTWRVIDDHPALRPERLEPGVTLLLAEGALPRREEAGDIEAPEVLFDPTGFDQPFLYTLRDEQQVLEVRRGDDGELTILAADIRRERAS